MRLRPLLAFLVVASSAVGSVLSCGSFSGATDATQQPTQTEAGAPTTSSSACVPRDASTTFVQADFEQGLAYTQSGTVFTITPPTSGISMTVVAPGSDSGHALDMSTDGGAFMVQPSPSQISVSGNSCLVTADFDVRVVSLVPPKTLPVGTITGAAPFVTIGARGGALGDCSVSFQYTAFPSDTAKDPGYYITSHCDLSDGGASSASATLGNGQPATFTHVTMTLDLVQGVATASVGNAALQSLQLRSDLASQGGEKAFVSFGFGGDDYSADVQLDNLSASAR